ncbi:hypothetical protein Tco_0496491 [Tanacetum coccineum]
MDVSGRLEGEFYPTYLTLLVSNESGFDSWVTTALPQIILKIPEYQGNFRNLSAVDAYNPEVAKASYINAVKALEDVDFPSLDKLELVD